MGLVPIVALLFALTGGMALIAHRIRTRHAERVAIRDAVASGQW